MGAWATGPFDNDGAADWANELNDARPEDRAGLVRSALILSDGYLDVDDGQAAVAAVAVVAGVHRGLAPDSARWPDFLANGEALHLPADLRDLASAALNRVTGPDSELQELWTEDGPNDEWASQIAALHAALATTL
jgi:hypothetical protein